MFDNALSYAGLEILVLAVSATLIGIGIWLNHVINRRNRRQATVEIALKHDEKTREGRRRVLSVWEHEGNLDRFAGRRHELSAVDREDYDAVYSLLENYEYIACSVRKKAFDYSLYARMCHTVVLEDWHMFASLINRIRREKDFPTAYLDFEWLAGDFSQVPLLEGVTPVERLAAWRRRFLYRLGTIVSKK